MKAELLLFDFLSVIMSLESSNQKCLLTAFGPQPLEKQNGKEKSLSGMA